MTASLLINNWITPFVKFVQVNMSSTSTPFGVRPANRTVELPKNLASESNEGLNQKATVPMFKTLTATQGLDLGVTEHMAAISYISNDRLKAPSVQTVPWHISI